jgi:hypothetical protein
MPGAGHGRGEDSGRAASKNASASGGRKAVTAGRGTREVSCRPWPTSTETAGIRREPKSGGTRQEKSEEGTGLRIVATTALDRKAGPLLQPSPARGSVTRPAPKGQPHPRHTSRQRQRRRYRAANRSRNRRFHALDDRLDRPDGRWRAGPAVRAHGGSAGVDGLSVAEVERQGVAAFLPS